MKRSGFLKSRNHHMGFLLVIALHFAVNNCYAQKDKELTHDIDIRKIPRITIPVKLEKFRSAELKNATAEYRRTIKSGLVSKSAIFSLSKKGYSNTIILGAVRNIYVPDFNFTIITNTEIAEDAQLMLKAIPTLTAADMITAIRDLYDVSTTKLFNIALLTLQDSTRRVIDLKQFSYLCDCKIKQAGEVSPSRPFRTSKTGYGHSYYHKKLYPWECFDYWNAGFRTVILPETTLNEFLRLMRISAYPLYEGMLPGDLADSSINFTVIMGTTADELSELMECTTLAYLPPGSGVCQNEVPDNTTISLPFDYHYSGTCKFQSVIKTRFHLKDVFNVLKRNGYSATTLATAAITRFSPADDDMRQKILASFDTNVFAASEILQASNVLNSN